MRFIYVAMLPLCALTACANNELMQDNANKLSKIEGQRKAHLEDQQIFSKSELNSISVPPPDMVAGATEKEVMESSALVKMRDDCISKNKKFLLKKLEEVGTTNIYAPTCQ